MFGAYGGAFRDLLGAIKECNDPVLGLELLVDKAISASLTSLAESKDYTKLERVAGELTSLSSGERTGNKWIKIHVSYQYSNNQRIADDVSSISLADLMQRYAHPIFEPLWRELKSADFTSYESEDYFLGSRHYTFYLVFFDHKHSEPGNKYMIAVGSFTTNFSYSIAHLEVGRMVGLEGRDAFKHLFNV